MCQIPMPRRGGRPRRSPHAATVIIAVHTSPKAASSVPCPLPHRSNIATATGSAVGRRQHDGERHIARRDQKDEQPPRHDRRPDQRNDDPAQRQQGRASGDPGGFLKLRMDLQHPRARISHAVGQVANGEGDDEGPDGAVDRKRHRKQDLDHRDSEHDAREHQRHGRELVEQDAAGATPHREPAAQDRHRHDEGGAAGTHHPGLPYEVEIESRMQDQVVVFQGDRLERVEADGLAERHQRQPQQGDSRHRQDQDEIQQDERITQIAHAAELEMARPVSAAGDGVKARRVPHQPGIEVQQDRREHQQHNGKRAGIAEIGRHVLLHVEIDLGGQGVDPAWKPHEGGHLEGFQRPHRDQDGDRAKRRQQHPQRDLNEGARDSRRRSSAPPPRNPHWRTGTPRPAAGMRAATTGILRSRSFRRGNTR